LRWMTKETAVMKAFDFDNTIYRGESSIDLAVYMIRNNKKIILYLPIKKRKKKNAANRT